MSYIGIQHGGNIGSDALNWVKDNPDKVAKAAWENRAKIFQTVSNAQRFVSKNIKKNPRPIRYLKEGEIHVMNHNFTGPNTKIGLPEVRNFKPYNNIDACSKVHDIEFNEIFKMPLGKERSEKIREADRKVLECYDKYPNESGYTLAKAGINSKIGLEDLSPTIFDKIMGEDYRGVEPELKKEAEKKRVCKGRNRKKCLSQQGGMIDPITGYLIATTPVALGLLYGEYKLGKTIYDKVRASQNQQIDETNA